MFTLLEENRLKAEQIVSQGQMVFGETPNEWSVIGNYFNGSSKSFLLAVLADPHNGVYPFLTVSQNDLASNDADYEESAHDALFAYINESFE